MEDVADFIRQSLELNLFFFRILKEHALFLQLGFSPKDSAYADEAHDLNKTFDALLHRAMRLAKGTVSCSVMTSGELFTRFTAEAERRTEFFTGVPIDTQLTEEEYELGGDARLSDQLLGETKLLNRDALKQAMRLVRFGQRAIADLLNCALLCGIPIYGIKHITGEAQHYIAVLQRLIAGDSNCDADTYSNEQVFWDRVMHEHGVLIATWVDPCEKTIKETSAVFARRFERLGEEAACDQGAPFAPIGHTDLIARTKEATARFRMFKAGMAEGILRCNVCATIAPLLADHDLREANRYLRLLREEQDQKA